MDNIIQGIVIAYNAEIFTKKETKAYIQNYLAMNCSVVLSKQELIKINKKGK